jgi:hypothetical protein
MKRKIIIITGREGTGSTFLSRTLYNGITNRFDWSGSGLSSDNINEKIIFNNQEIILFHRTQPCNTVDYFTELDDLKKKYKNDDIYFIITTRYNIITNITNSNRFNRTDLQNQDNSKKCKKIIGDIIKKEKYFIWNYETMLFLKEIYFEMLYNFLELELDYIPNKIEDGNLKYIKFN